MQQETERSDRVRREMADVIARTGPWTSHNIELAPGIFTRDNKISGEEVKLRRMTQLVRDLVGRPIDQVRALDLGALEGLYGIELALEGAEVVFVEGRDANAEKIRFALNSLGIERGKVYTQDVRELSLATHGSFDAILCIGLLYHLELESVLRLLTTMREICTGVVVIDTHVALEDDELRRAAGRLWIDPDTLSPIQTVKVDGESYRGRNYVEHHPGSPPEQRRRALWSSLDNETSFWPTKQSLVNAMMRAGFTSVLECVVPPLPGNLAPDRVHLVAIAGQRRALASSSIYANVDYEQLLESRPPDAGEYVDDELPRTDNRLGVVQGDGLQEQQAQSEALLRVRDEEILRLRVRLQRIQESLPARVYNRMRAWPFVRAFVASRTAGYEAELRRRRQQGAPPASSTGSPPSGPR